MNSNIVGFFVTLFSPIYWLKMSVKKPSSDFYPPQTSIDFDDLVEWPEWLNHLSNLEVTANNITLPQESLAPVPLNPRYPNLIDCTTETMDVELADIFGIDSSKANMSKFTSLEDMVIERCPDLLDESIDDLLSWPELRFESAVNQPHISLYAWDGRKYLCQTGGSHHFAAAHFRSVTYNERRTLRLPVKITSLNKTNVERLLNDVGLFYCPNPMVFEKVSKALVQARICYVLYRSPFKGGGTTFILSRIGRKNIRVANSLKSVLVDLGDILKILIEQQSDLLRFDEH